MFRPPADHWTRAVARQCAACRSVDRSGPLEYSGATRDLVLDLKYRGRQSVARLLAAELVRTIHDDHGVEHGFELVTWAPTSDRRRRRRGYDQAQTIARHVARSLGLPCRRLLFRSDVAPQTGRDRRSRLLGPVFQARPSLRSRRVLVIDDVVTTGATLRAAAHALTVAGWNDVVTVAAVATPVQEDRPVRSRTRRIAGD